MKERPILFSAPMVRAVLDGSKTQTRRIMKSQPHEDWSPAGYGELHGFDKNGELTPNKVVGWGAFNEDGDQGYCCPYGRPGDRLWVRESWRGVVSINPPGSAPEYGVARYIPDQEHCRRVEYAASQERDSDPWRPSIHMPRWASRILLEIVSVRVEQLADISEADARAEGATGGHGIVPSYNYNATPSEHFSHIWESINGAGSWKDNPWLWVIEFKRVTP